MVEIKCVVSISRIRNHNWEQSNSQLCRTHNPALLACVPSTSFSADNSIACFNYSKYCTYCTRQCLHSYWFCTVFLWKRLFLGWTTPAHTFTNIWSHTVAVVVTMERIYKKLSLMCWDTIILHLLFENLSFWFVDLTHLPFQCVL